MGLLKKLIVKQFLKIWRNRFGGLSIVLSIVFLPIIGMIFFDQTPPLVKAEREARQKYEYEIYKSRQKGKAEQKKYLCEVKPICERYATARFQCAVAANLQSCIDIKIGDEDASYVSACTNDGKVAGITSADMPSALSCYFSK